MCTVSLKDGMLLCKEINFVKVKGLVFDDKTCHFWSHSVWTEEQSE